MASSCDAARETCARFFRDGREPADAYGLVLSEAAGPGRGGDAIAEAVCAGPARLRKGGARHRTDCSI